MGEPGEEGTSAVERYYDSGVEREWERLERHRMEYAITLRVLTEYLPPAPCAVLDVGGGPGRYALALAERGYAVTLLDLAREPRPGTPAGARARTPDRGVHPWQRARPLVAAPRLLRCRPAAGAALSPAGRG